LGLSLAGLGVRLMENQALAWHRRLGLHAGADALPPCSRRPCRRDRRHRLGPASWHGSALPAFGLRPPSAPAHPAELGADRPRHGKCCSAPNSVDVDERHHRHSRRVPTAFSARGAPGHRTQPCPDNRSGEPTDRTLRRLSDVPRRRRHRRACALRRAHRDPRRC
jgi:hypothetical protein